MREIDREIKYVKGERETLKGEQQMYLDYKGQSFMSFCEDIKMVVRDGMGVGVRVHCC